MNWRRSAIGGVVALPILGLLAWGMTRDPNAIPSTLPGRPAPDFALPVMDSPSDTVRLADLRGDIVVLNFWASWCLECRYEHGDLSRAATRYAPFGVQFYGILYNDSPRLGRAWIEEMGGQSYPTLLDQGSRAAISYGLYGVPETFVIDRDGTVLYKQIGAITMSRLTDILDPLVAAEPAGPVTPGADAGTP